MHVKSDVDRASDWSLQYSYERVQELRNWLLGRTLSSVAMARRALRSLHALLGQISNMVIRDEVAAQVHAATRSLALALDLLASDSGTLDCAAVRESSPGTYTYSKAPLVIAHETRGIKVKKR